MLDVSTERNFIQTINHYSICMGHMHGLRLVFVPNAFHSGGPIRFENNKLFNIYFEQFFCDKFSINAEIHRMKLQKHFCYIKFTIKSMLF